MGFTRAEVLVTGVIILLMLALLLPAIQQAKEAARRSQSKNNLKQIGLALQNYHDTHGVLPTGGIFNHEQRGMIGWMVSLAPYMDSSPLYSQLDLNQPWDSTRNAGVLLRRYHAYEVPGEPTQVTGWNFPYAHYSANAYVMAANRWVPLSEIESPVQTFLAAELAGDFTPWASPHNWRPLTTLNGQPPTYGRYGGIGGHFLMADGHVEFVANEAYETRRDSLAGADLTEFQTRGGEFPRPVSFLVPDDTLAPTFIGFPGQDRWVFALQNRDAQIIELFTSGPYKHQPLSATARDIAQIAGYQHLETLLLSGDFTADELAPLRSLSRLKTLTLQSDRLTADGLNVLSPLPQLRELTVQGQWVTPRAVQTVQLMLPKCSINWQK